MLLPQYVLVFAGALVRSFFPPFVRLFVLAHYDQEHYQSVQTSLGTQHASLYPLRDRLTADDCVGTAFLPISAISGQGDDGESATVEKLTGTVCTVFGCSNNELVINVRFPPSGFLPLFGPCFVNFYGSTREYSDLPDEYDDLNIGMVSRAQVVYLLRREKSTSSTQFSFHPGCQRLLARVGRVTPETKSETRAEHNLLSNRLGCIANQQTFQQVRDLQHDSTLRQGGVGSEWGRLVSHSEIWIWKTHSGQCWPAICPIVGGLLLHPIINFVCAFPGFCWLSLCLVLGCDLSLGKEFYCAVL